ncbi:MAG: excinuclease ABC subunit UvrC [Thermoplasmatota archaeon]
MIDHINLPTSPGCYLFKDEQGEIIYIGKAKNLKKRVKTYFQKSDLDIKTRNLIFRVSDIEVIATDNEYEALILENNLVKQHQPKYNIRLKDSKSFAFIQITYEHYPRVMIARGKPGRGTYYGPFVSAQERDYILQFLRKTFHLRTCKKMPKKPCLRHHIHLCDAPCIGKISPQEYTKRIDMVKQILCGRSADVLSMLDTEMKNQSQQQQYEQALRLRNQIVALNHLTERQKMQRMKTYDEDILNYSICEGKVYLMMFNIHKGTLVNKNEFMFEWYEDFLDDFISQFYAENPIPKEIILPTQISSAVKEFLCYLKKSKIKITVPQRGEKKQLLQLVLKNIDISFFSEVEKTNELKKQLNMQESPTVIECFDISHISGTSIVGSMVQFRNGKPDKTNYRRFKIRTIDSSDDTAALAEIIQRRYHRLLFEDELLPDLIIIDGGKGQLNAALHQLDKLQLQIPIIAIAKKFEEIYLPGKPESLRLNKKNKALQFIQQIRDEAHRFAINYNRLLRKKEVIP